MFDQLIEDLHKLAVGELKEKWFFQSWEKKVEEVAHLKKNEILVSIFEKENYTEIQKLRILDTLDVLFSGYQYRVAFSPSDECQELILQSIKKAKQQIDICVFTISDNDISKEIIRAKKRGVHIRILTDNDKQFDKGSDIYDLEKAGITVRFDRTDNHMHHKFAIFDHKELLTGSYNWTRSAKLYNNENIIIVKHPKMIDDFQEEFNQLWQKYKV
ncbi:MAG: phospholipase D-like domain-containing protein [Flavobacteriales bacterium]|jgi:phosphatidylserine/phosphatidylglycerophosphate/cardiolipin synthase-like enzyme|nr:phospholipase D-like domain-containing protein [Flavobacteriales bacterium]